MSSCLVATLLALTFALPGLGLQEPTPAPTPAVTVSAAEGTLAIRLSGFRSAEGQVLIAIFRGEDGFPGDSAKAWRRAVTTIQGARASFDLQGVPAGEYAIAVVHDENKNGELDTNFVGIPKEGLGVSNNVKIRVGPPKYRDAKFAVEGAVLQDIRIRYF